jgi:hypothetical protein
MLAFCNCYVLWLLRCVKLRLVTATFCDVAVVWCYVLSQYLVLNLALAPSWVSMGHLLNINCVDSMVNTHILATTSVPFTLTPVQVPNLALTYTKRITVQPPAFHPMLFWLSNSKTFTQWTPEVPASVQTSSQWPSDFLTARMPGMNFLLTNQRFPSDNLLAFWQPDFLLKTSWLSRTHTST